ncbi:hypothetical protein [Gallaecimonas sp. GXIMD4217]|uniref:hypothetical protein n=1 Tax=Gallaecimonas sp. GXIMD4217 TaxID=3131927 RepID=UPI00311ADA5C
MKALGLLLVTVCFLVGAFLTSLDPRTLAWSGFLPLLLVGMIGVYLIKRAEHLEARHEGVMEDNLKVLRESLENLVAELDTLVAKKDDIPVYEARFEIDHRLRNDLRAFAEARYTLAHRYSLAAFAEVMSPFAAGERYVNRVWSASADGYIDEVHQYLDKAKGQFHEALDALSRWRSGEAL